MPRWWLVCVLVGAAACSAPTLSAERDLVTANGEDLAGADLLGADLVKPVVDLAGAASDAAGGADLAGPIDVGPTRYPHDAVVSPITASVKARMQAIASASATRQPNVFMKVGASGTVSTNLLFCFAGASQPQYVLDLDGRDALQPTIDYFRGGDIQGATPFDRVTLAAKVGQTAKWAITGSPSPLSSELMLANPRFAFVNYGTNDMEAGSTYENALFAFYDNLSTLLDDLEAAGVVPLVAGLNPRSDLAAQKFVPTFDVVTRAMAEARQLPYLSLYRLSAPLANQGLLADGLHGNVLVVDGKAQPCEFTAAGLGFNYNGRNLQSIVALDAAKRMLVDGAAAPDAPVVPALVGDGAKATPFVIDALPFSHAGTTVGGESLLATYPVCSTGQDESGPERYYALHLAQPKALRIMVFDRGAVDVDVHVLQSDGSCLGRNDRILEGTISAGDYVITVDSFVSGGVAKAGAYQLVVVECEAGDDSCK